jgi:hypothetical protein
MANKRHMAIDLPLLYSFSDKKPAEQQLTGVQPP